MTLSQPSSIYHISWKSRLCDLHFTIYIRNRETDYIMNAILSALFAISYLFEMLPVMGLAGLCSRGTKVEKMLTLAPERYTAGFCMLAKVILWCI